MTHSVMFSINEYDYEGDIHTEGFFLRIDEIVKLKFATIEDIKNFQDRIGLCIDEIKEQIDDAY